MGIFSVSAVTIRLGGRSWTCSACRSQLARSKQLCFFGSRRYASRAPSPSPGHRGRWERPRRRLLYASSGAAAGASILAFTDDIKSGYDAAERTGRVAVALGICINEYAAGRAWAPRLNSLTRLADQTRSYRSTLKANEEIVDAEEQTSLLKACHKRCAERTLRVLEKNGGIFIKLGQHLVSLSVRTSAGPESRPRCC